MNKKSQLGWDAKLFVIELTSITGVVHKAARRRWL